MRVFDYVDRSVSVLARMFEKRLRGYRAMGYEPMNLPPEYEEPSRELRIEWDDQQGLTTTPDSPDEPADFG